MGVSVYVHMYVRACVYVCVLWDYLFTVIVVHFSVYSQVILIIFAGFKDRQVLHIAFCQIKFRK